ncbi:NADH_oxidase [Hexamita inflata]|uniref:NADH_oxidase n=1 Tax=Hexamita inflata TaxID=28002 RepID=A0ABP1GRQ2_9EUKA
MHQYVIIGAGPAGCIISRMIKKQFPDDTVILIEQSKDVGYQANCPFLHFKYGKHPDAVFVQNMDQIKKSKIDLILDEQISRIDYTQKLVVGKSKQYKFDKLIFAIGQQNTSIPNTIPSRSCAQLRALRKQLQTESTQVNIIGNNMTAILLADSLKDYPTKIYASSAALELDVEYKILELIKKELKSEIVFSTPPTAVPTSTPTINTLTQPHSTFSIKQNMNYQQPSVYAIGSCTYPQTTQQFIFTQAVYILNHLMEKNPPPLQFLNNRQFSLGTRVFGRVGANLSESCKLVTISDSFRAEFMPTHHVVHVHMIVENETGIIRGIQVGSKHDVSQYMQIGALIVGKQMTAAQLILQDFFFQPHFGKPFHLFNVAAVAACGEVPPFEEYK